MSRQPGGPMRRLLALHEEWRVANGYPLQVSREKKIKLHNSKHKRRATTYKRKSPKTKSTGASGLSQASRLSKSLS
jgi:hypothetical protein